MVYGTFEIEYEPHPLTISKFRTWDAPRHSPRMLMKQQRPNQWKNCLPRFMVSPPTTVPLALSISTPRQGKINLAQSSILQIQRAKLLF